MSAPTYNLEPVEVIGKMRFCPYCDAVQPQGEDNAVCGFCTKLFAGYPVPEDEPAPNKPKGRPRKEPTPLLPALGITSGPRDRWTCPYCNQSWLGRGGVQPKMCRKCGHKLLGPEPPAPEAMSDTQPGHMTDPGVDAPIEQRQAYENALAGAFQRKPRTIMGPMSANGFPRKPNQNQKVEEPTNAPEVN
jgi:hypothetical protein